LKNLDTYTIRNVLDQGKPITVDPMQPIEVGKDGVVRQSGQDLGKMEIGSPDADPLSLSKLGNSYFMMGDHRSISSDSREFGPVERNLIYGKAVFVYWPARDAGRAGWRESRS